MKRNTIIWVVLLLAIDIGFLGWSVNYLISYASQDKIVALAFGFVVAACLFCFNKVILFLAGNKKNDN